MQHFTWEGTAPERYPVLLDADGEPRSETIRDFLLWLKDQELSRAAGFKEAQKWLQASMQMERKRRGLPVLGEGKANEYMEVRIAGQEQRIAAGMSKIVAGSDLSKRADRVPDMEDKIKMMHVALSGAAIVHHNPLLVVQTGFEVLCTHATGVRGQLVRSAKFEHIWGRKYAELAGGAGIEATVMYNVRGDKTHVEGDGTHTGWLPARNALLCPSSTLGLVMLYRFTPRNRRRSLVMNALTR